MFETDVQTRSQYLKQINGGEGNNNKEDIIVPPNMDRDEVTKIYSQDAEERAALLFETFFRITSVIYDTQSMAALLKREDLDVITQETIAHLLFNTLVQMNQMRVVNNLNVSKAAGDSSGTAGSSNMIYSKYWDLSTGYLKLSVLNEMIQTFRTTPRLLEPLLRIMFILGKQSDSSPTVHE
jgi:hypothetical protein